MNRALSACGPEVQRIETPKPLGKGAQWWLVSAGLKHTHPLKLSATAVARYSTIQNIGTSNVWYIVMELHLPTKA
jgi:hypothetical protein